MLCSVVTVKLGVFHSIFCPAKQESTKLLEILSNRSYQQWYGVHLIMGSFSVGLHPRVVDGEQDSRGRFSI